VYVCFSMYSYPRLCPRRVADGGVCDYVARSDNSFRRHVIVHHAERWSINRHGGYETFHRMSPREALEYRVALANRQGGRGRFRRMLMNEVRDRPDVSVPPPPPLPRYCRPQTTTANRVDEPPPKHRCRWAQSATVDGDTLPPPTINVAAGGMAATGGHGSAVGAAGPVVDDSNEDIACLPSTPPPNVLRDREFIPGEYKRVNTVRVSSLLDGEISEMDRQLEGTLFDIDNDMYDVEYADLHEPIVHNRSHVRHVTFHVSTHESDLEGVDPNVVVPPPAKQSSTEWEPSAVKLVDPIEQEGLMVGAPPGLTHSRVGRRGRGCGRDLLRRQIYDLPRSGSPNGPNGVRGTDIMCPDITHRRAAESQPPLNLEEVYIPPAPFKDIEVQTEMRETPVEVACQTEQPVSEVAVQATMTADVRNVKLQCTLHNERKSRGTQAAYWPRPWLREPETDLLSLARHTSQISFDAKDQPITRVTDKVSSAVHEGDVSRRRTISLMVQYGGYLLREASQYLLHQCTLRFGDRADVTERDVCKFVTDELAVWAKRPDMTNVIVLDYDEGDRDQSWLR